MYDIYMIGNKLQQFFFKVFGFPAKTTIHSSENMYVPIEHSIHSIALNDLAMQAIRRPGAMV